MSISITTAEQIVGFAFSIGAMAFSKNNIFSSDRAVMAIRIAFILSSLIQIGAYLFIRQKIISTNNQNKFKYKSTAPLQDDEIEMSVYEYDMAECTKAIKGTIFQVLITSFIHYKWKGIQPVLIQAIGIVKPVLFSGLFREYIYSQKMERPFEKNMLFSTSASTEEPVVQEIKSNKKKEE